MSALVASTNGARSAGGSTPGGSFLPVFREFSVAEVINVGGGVLRQLRISGYRCAPALARPYLPATHVANNGPGLWLGWKAGDDFLSINYLVEARK